MNAAAVIVVAVLAGPLVPALALVMLLRLRPSATLQEGAEALATVLRARGGPRVAVPRRDRQQTPGEPADDG